MCEIHADADEDQDGKINLEEFVYLVQECSRAATRALNMTMMEAGIDTFRLETNSPGFEGEEEEEISHPVCMIPSVDALCFDLDDSPRLSDLVDGAVVVLVASPCVFAPTTPPPLESGEAGESHECCGERHC